MSGHGEREVRIYRSARRQEMYLYVDVAEDLSRVPEALLQRFGKPLPALELLLTPQRKLARVDVTKVLAAIAAEGYYLQMPPASSYGHPV
ncbi:MAG: YcgL domain-containing protein [Pseudomonadales bacterium]